MAKKKTTKKSTKKDLKAKEDPKKSTAKKTSAKKTTAKKASAKKTTAKNITEEKIKDAETSEVKPNEEEKKKEEEEKKKEEEMKHRIECFKKAGEIAKKVKEFIKPHIKVGAKLIDLITLAEDKIVELGGKPGFPVNISLNNIAAHYTSPPGDSTEIKEGDIVKFDFGVHIEGYSVDNAFTISFNNEPALKNLIKATEEAVEVAISLIKPGMKTNHIGGKIEEVIKKYGYKPIKDLTGHNIEQWELHAGKAIPCIKTPPGTGQTIEENDVFAVEVFASNGEGTIHAQKNAFIFELDPRVRKIPLRNKKARKLLGYIANEYKTLPFSKFQITRLPDASLFGLKLIIDSGRLHSHPVLAEKKGFYVAQTEETVIVTKDGCEKIT
ncbi:MAG: type II methionyl aminopeptidase [Promethearchaeota archaeon]